MFEKHVLTEESFHEEDGGWAVDLRIPYYRGLGLSMVDLSLALDGVEVPAEEVTVELPGRRHRLTELPGLVDDRWGFGETLTAHVAAPALPAGEHEVRARIGLRISYLPVPSVTTVQRRVTVSR